MLFDILDYYCYIPLNGYEIKPEPIGTWPMRVEEAKCKRVGTAVFAGNSDSFDVYCQECEIGYHNNKRRELVNFVLLPKNITQRFTIDLYDGGSYFYGTSEIVLNFARPVKMQHIITCQDLHKYIHAGGSIINKQMNGNFKFANIKISNSKFVSL